MACAPRGPPGEPAHAAAAGHGIVDESDDIVANWRLQLPGGDLHGSNKQFSLVNRALPWGPAISDCFQRGSSK
jgi:hypothetical protein